MPVVRAIGHAAADADRPAVVDGATGQRLSRGELAARSAALAAALTQRGVGRGDLVAVAMPNLASWPVLAMGVWRADAALVPLSPLWTAAEAGRLLARVRPRVAIVHEAQARVVEEAIASAGIAADVVDGEAPGESAAAGGSPGRFASPRLDSRDLAVVAFSSGTGGLPKGVRLTHGNLAAAAAQFATSLELGPASVALAGTPFFHAIGLGLGLCAPLSVGASIVTLPMPAAEPVLELIAEHRVTHAIVPPPVFEQIAAHPRLGRYDTSSLELLGSGGAHLSSGAERRASERIGCLARGGYGMTEAFPVSAPLGGYSEPGTVGWLVPGTEARLVDPGSGRDAEPGRSAELWVRGPQVMDGYFDDPDATAATLTVDGWLRTGDLVAIRPDGQLVIEGRLKELIKVRGASVAPAELELVLCEHPSVRDAAVVGRPAAGHGEVPVAYVVLSGPAGSEELISFVAARVAPYKRLHEVSFVAALPRMPSGKLLRQRLRDTHPTEGSDTA